MYGKYYWAVIKNTSNWYGQSIHLGFHNSQNWQFFWVFKKKKKTPQFFSFETLKKIESTNMIKIKLPPNTIDSLRLFLFMKIPNSWRFSKTTRSGLVLFVLKDWKNIYIRINEYYQNQITQPNTSDSCTRSSFMKIIDSLRFLKTTRESTWVLWFWKILKTNWNHQILSKSNPTQHWWQQQPKKKAKRKYEVFMQMLIVTLVKKKKMDRKNLCLVTTTKDYVLSIGERWCVCVCVCVYYKSMEH